MTTYAEHCCEVCGIHVSKAAMHRANPIGEKGRWRCESCLGKPVDPTVKAVTDTIQNEGLSGLLGKGVTFIDPDGIDLD
jgi:hypothetical protein